MPIKQPENQLWAVYNHMPGGQMVAIHFEDVTRTKKVGEGTQTVLFTGKDQLEAFKKSPQVALFLGGKLTKNEMLVYDGDTRNMWKDPKCASKVLAWATSKGMKNVPGAPSGKGDQPKTYEYDQRIGALEEASRKQQVMLEEILARVSPPKGS